MKYGIYIGPEKGAVVEVRKAIMEILNARADQETIRVALNILKDGVSIDNVSISNCSVIGGEK